MKNLHTYADALMDFFGQTYSLQNNPQVNFVEDHNNSASPLGSTAHYDSHNKAITIYITGRHIKDCLRSLAHELVHHLQKERGDLDNAKPTSLGYAQSDEHLREMEREAYEKGNMCFRDWEDNLKISNKELYETIYKDNDNQGERIMSTKDWKNEELNILLMNKWGYSSKEDTTTTQVLKEEVGAFLDTSKGGDYKGAEKKYPDDALEEEEEEELDTHPHDVEKRIEKSYEAAPDLYEERIRAYVRKVIEELT